MRRRLLRSAMLGIASGTCMAATAANARAGTTPLTTERVAVGLSLPLYVTHATGDFDRVFILEQRSGSTGRIRILNIDVDPPTLNATPYLSISPVATGSEQGLLGMALHPDFLNNGYFWVDYTNSAGTTVIARYQANAPFATSTTANAATATTVLTIAQPFSNHNGGWIAFGPDGYLYIAMGDGGSANDPSNNAQNINVLLGKMLRIDVDGADNIPGNADDDGFPADATKLYTIPATNPFAAGAGADEIWSIGLRNPWRDSFDRGTGDLYIGDVGQGSIEEIDFQIASSPSTPVRNYGWDCMEGNSCLNNVACTCNSAPLTQPIHTYSHAGGHCSVTGGYVYRGGAMPDMQGIYFFADYCSATIWSFRYTTGGGVTQFTNRTAELDPPGALSIGAITSFGEDAAGEIYICDQAGEVFKIIPDIVPPANDNCSGAIVVSLGSTAITNVEATGEGVTETCGSFAADVWYRLTVAEDCVLDASVCDATFNTQLAIYGAGCPGGNNTALACNEDSCGTGSQVSLAVTAGLYRIRVGSSTGATGTGTLELDCVPIPPTGACCNDDGTCDDAQEQAACETAGGVYQGDDVLCSAVSCPQPCPEDIVPPGGDGQISIADITAVLAAFGPCGKGDCPADVVPPGGDGQVTIADITAIMSAFGPCN